MFQGFLNEADTVVRKFNVQGIRRITNTGRRKSIAMMGDGNFYFSKKYFNNYAKTFSASEIKELEKFKVAQQKRKDILKPKLDKAKEKIKTTSSHLFSEFPGLKKRRELESGNFNTTSS